MLVRHNNTVHAVLRKFEDFGFEVYDLVGPPERLSAENDTASLVTSSVDKRRVNQIESMTQIARQSIQSGPLLAKSKRALAKLNATFLLAEDPQRRLEVRKAATLMHQVSLVQHIFDRPELQRVLIGDEVGLGKTIEAGLIIQRLVAQNPNHRILYLAPAKLVQNVVGEFRDKLDLNARSWVAGSSSDARLESDKIVVASINKAVFGENSQKIISTGPWDVIIVDECHHLSDWGKGGGSPNQAYKLVANLIKGQNASGRLVLLSGTPHQGSETRFVNILRLLSEDENNFYGAAGRVIFRTKDRVSDWRGKPLFPGRQINPPIVVSMGTDYEEWYQSIGSLYESGAFGTKAMRAAGWAKGQALQWAASSVEAGLGFLVRLAIRRLGWDLENLVLKNALSSLRPYRGGPTNESIPLLFERINKSISKKFLDEQDIDDEESEDDEWRPDPGLLSDLISDGINLLKDKSGIQKWNALFNLIDEHPSEKIVLFAQPIETVLVVAKLLEDRYGVKPSVIIGAQKEDERRNEVQKFQSPMGPRFLVSSRAGGEGLNLQCSRWLIHLDVPWNPMELEQRIGRVHRFGSRKTILVDTLVTAGSREVDMYQIARQKLAMVAQHLDPEEFENLFTRVMSLVPPKELEGVMSANLIREAYVGHLDQELGRLVSEGFQTWNEFDAKYRGQAQKIRSLDSGLADWIDVQNYLTEYCGAEIGEKASFTSFEFSDGEIIAVDDSINTLQIEGKVFCVGDTGGLIPISKTGKIIEQIGLNSELLKNHLKNHFSINEEGSAIFLRKSKEIDFLNSNPGPVVIFNFMVQRLRQDGVSWTEMSIKSRFFIKQDNEIDRELNAEEVSGLMQCLSRATKMKDADLSILDWESISSKEESLYQALRKPDDGDISLGIRHAVWPIGLIILV